MVLCLPHATPGFAPGFTHSSAEHQDRRAPFHPRNEKTKRSHRRGITCGPGQEGLNCRQPGSWRAERTIVTYPRLAVGLWKPQLCTTARLRVRRSLAPVTQWCQESWGHNPRGSSSQRSAQMTPALTRPFHYVPSYTGILTLSSPLILVF